MLSISDCLRLANQLTSVSDTARLDIELLLCHILKKNRTFLFTWPEHVLTAQEQIAFHDFFSRRAQGEPIAHILGEREFWSLPLSVNASTLIPRPDTEILVETTLSLFNEDEPNLPRTCLDLGTGTGAIALALASEKPQWRILAVDQSPDAVALAASNRDKLLLTHVSVLQSNWFAAVPDFLAKNTFEKFDVIVSNPPYIDPNDSHLREGDVRFEPLSALIADNAGMADLDIIIDESRAFLAKGGWLVLEHGYQQAPLVHAQLHQAGFENIATQKDYGNNDRVTYARWP